MAKSTGKLIKEGIFTLFAFLLLILLYFFFVIDYDCCANDPHPEKYIKKQKVELGRDLFFDTRLSGDNSISCASCHLPKLAFTDGRKVPQGVEGRLGFRNSPSLLNARDATSFMFDAEIKSLEEQAIVPIQDHAEMDISMGDLIKKLNKIEEYRSRAKKLYSRDFDALVLTKALASFQRTLVSNNSIFDQFISSGDSSLMTSEQLNGWKKFNDLRCIECHQLPNFTNYQAMNNGLYLDYGEDQGRFRVTHDTIDMGKFKVPSLRNIILTAPYMHDGSISTLDGVFEHYKNGPKEHINKDKRLENFNISSEEQRNVIRFLEALTDTSYLINYR